MRALAELMLKVTSSMEPVAEPSDNLGHCLLSTQLQFSSSDFEFALLV
jgi:hypothetical protein